MSFSNTYCYSRTPFFLLTVVLALVTQSCIYEDIEACTGDFYAKLTIINNWKNAPSAYPEGMAYFFFPASGGDYRRFDMAGREGGEVKLPTGRYDCILFNDDTATVIESGNDSFADMSLSTSPGQLYLGNDIIKDYPQSVAALNQPVLMNPDQVWSYSTPGIDVLLTEGNRTITTYPAPLTATYHIIVENISNLDGVAAMSGAMSGMAKKVRLRDRELSESPVILPTGLARNSERTITGQFHTFGRCSLPSTDNILFLFFRLTNGKKYTYAFNVTETVKTAPDPMDVWIILKGLELPASDPSQGGSFDVSVDGWNNIIINL